MTTDQRFDLTRDEAVAVLRKSTTDGMTAYERYGMIGYTRSGLLPIGVSWYAIRQPDGSVTGVTI
jgi:hypothetical protein